MLSNLKYLIYLCKRRLWGATQHRGAPAPLHRPDYKSKMGMYNHFMTSLIHSLISLSHLHLFLFESCHSSCSRLAHKSDLTKKTPRQCTTSDSSYENARPSIHYTEGNYTQNCKNSNFRVRISKRNQRGSEI